MKNSKTRTRILLLVAFMLGVAAVLAPAAWSSVNEGPNTSWEVTEASINRSLETGECTAYYDVCKELCENGMGTGIFQCFLVEF